MQSLWIELPGDVPLRYGPSPSIFEPPVGHPQTKHADETAETSRPSGYQPEATQNESIDEAANHAPRDIFADVYVTYGYGYGY